MRIIGTTPEGNTIAEISAQEIGRLRLAITDLQELIDRVVTPFDVADTKREKTPGTLKAPRQTRKKTAAPAKKERGADKCQRNKKCADCGGAFYDDSRTNCRKWCGLHGCKNGKAPVASSEPKGEDKASRLERLRAIGRGLE